MNKDIIQPKYNKGLVGDTPAALYLIDLLNQSQNKKEASVIKYIQRFRETFKQLVSAYDNGHLELGVVNSFISAKRIELNISCEQLIKDGCSELVINLYHNVILGDIKHFQRVSSKQRLIEISAIDRAKALLKNKGIRASQTSISTYGQINKEVVEKLDTEVSFNLYGVPEVNFDKSAVKDETTSETLLNRSVTRLKRLGRYPHAESIY